MASKNGGKSNGAPNSNPTNDGSGTDKEPGVHQNGEQKGHTSSTRASIGGKKGPGASGSKSQGSNVPTNSKKGGFNKSTKTESEQETSSTPLNNAAISADAAVISSNKKEQQPSTSTSKLSKNNVKQEHTPPIENSQAQPLESGASHATAQPGTSGRSAASNAGDVSETPTTGSTTAPGTEIQPRGSDSNSKPMCRICFLSDSETNLLNPLILPGCRCFGNGLYTHRECLQRWINMKRSNVCEICNERFTLEVGPEVVTQDQEDSSNNMVWLHINGANLQFGRYNARLRNEEEEFAMSQRPLMLGLFVLMAGLTVIAGAFAIFFSHQVSRKQAEAAAAGRNSTHAIQIDNKDPAVTGFELSISVFVFFLIMTLTFSLIWCCIEFYVLPFITYPDEPVQIEPRPQDMVIHPRNVRVSV